MRGPVNAKTIRLPSSTAGSASTRSSNAVQIGAEAWIEPAAEQVEASHPGTTQRAAARTVEVDVVVDRAACRGVVQVDLQPVGPIGAPHFAKVIARIRLHDFEPVVIGRQGEPLSCGVDDIGAQLHRRHMRARQVPVAELGQRRRPETELKDALRFGDEAAPPPSSASGSRARVARGAQCASRPGSIRCRNAGSGHRPLRTA